MKKSILLAMTTIALVACGKKQEKKESLYPEAVSETTTDPLVTKGKELFESNKAACFSCHQLDKKVIGPSIQEIAKIYQEKNGNILAFLKKEADPIVDPSQYNVMETNFAILKTMTDEELKSLEAYIMSTIK